MLRIDIDNDARVTTLRLSGRIQSDRIVRIQSALGGDARKILDLGEVTLVDVAAVGFLIRCEDDGVELAWCPPYVREWIARERAEATQSGLSTEN